MSRCSTQNVLAGEARAKGKVKLVVTAEQQREVRRWDSDDSVRISELQTEKALRMPKSDFIDSEQLQTEQRCKSDAIVTDAN